MKVKCANGGKILCHITDERYDELKEDWYIEHEDTADGLELILLVRGHICVVRQ